MDSTPSRLRVQLVDSWKKKKNLRGVPPERKNAKALEGCKNEPWITEPVKVNKSRRGERKMFTRISSPTRKRKRAQMI